MFGCCQFLTQIDSVCFSIAIGLIAKERPDANAGSAAFFIPGYLTGGVEVDHDGRLCESNQPRKT